MIWVIIVIIILVLLMILVQTSPCGEVWFEIWLKAHGKIWNHTRRSRVWFQIFPCALKAKSQITPLRRVMFAINTTTTSRRVCFNPKRTEKPCALGFSVRFGLKHTLHCVIWVKSWKLEVLIWAESGVIVENFKKSFKYLNDFWTFQHQKLWQIDILLAVWSGGE